MVDILLKRNKGLLKIRTRGRLPLMCAIWSGHKDIVEYMYSMTDIVDEKWKVSDKKSLLNSCIVEGLFDIALKIMNDCKKEGTLMIIGTEVLRYLASKPAAFDGKIRPFLRRLVNKVLPGPGLGSVDNSVGVEIVRNIWEEIVKQKHEDILKTVVGDYKKKEVEGLLFVAARLGNYKFIIELLRLYPEIAWSRDDNKYTIFHVAVIHRQENVYNLLYELGSKKLGTLDKDKNNILHLAAMKPAKSRLKSASFFLVYAEKMRWIPVLVCTLAGLPVIIFALLQYSLLFDVVNSTFNSRVYSKRSSLQDVLRVVVFNLYFSASLLSRPAQDYTLRDRDPTIMFAAAFTLPGGNNGDTGHPIFLKKSAFIVFVVADAVSLCTSSASILMFLAILTSRYAEKDFLVSLPVKLMVGLITVFFSIVTMMIAFSASFFLLYAESMKWIPASIAALAGVPVVLFALLQFRLLFDVINSTFNSRHLFRPQNRMI
nr:PREDICTED: ankyrin repeat-containing protein At3g12360-like [Daucus carota subsp. sativus]